MNVPLASCSRCQAARDRSFGPEKVHVQEGCAHYVWRRGQRARAFYETILGFGRGSSSNNGVWTEYDLPGGGCLALFKQPDPAQRQQRAAEAQASRSRSKTWTCSSLY